jgi:UDP-glucose 4-epimerase
MVNKKLHTVLVTGGAGYIGAVVVRELQNAGYTTVIVDNFSTGQKHHVQGTFYNIDLLKKEKLKKVFSKHQIDAVMHFASLTIPSESMQKPSLYYFHNIQSTLNLLDVMVEFKTPYVIFSSSCSVYGSPKKLPVTEKDPINPQSVYASTKAIIEQILSLYEKTNNIKFVSLRYFNAAGATLDGTLGELHTIETHLIPNALLSVLNKKPFSLYGNDYMTPDGTCIRDFIHILDVADAHMKALSYLMSGKESNKFNLGTGQGYSIGQVIKEIEKETKQKIKISIKKRRLGDPDAVYADNTKAKKILKWQPHFSDLTTIINSAYLWHKRNLA